MIWLEKRMDRMNQKISSIITAISVLILKHEEFEAVKKDLDEMKIEQEKDKELRKSLEDIKNNKIAKIKKEQENLQVNEDKIKKGLPGMG
jgi:hypothetical protein